MQKTTRVTPAIARQIEEASKGAISFEFGETNCTEIRVKVKVGKQLCDCVTQPEHAGLRINYKHRFTGKSETLEIPCDEL